MLILPHLGIVTNGGSEVDESNLTRESVGVAKGIGSPILSGTTNGGAALIAKVTKLPHETRLQKMAALLEGVEFKKSKMQGHIDKAVKAFIPVVFIFSVLAFIFWVPFGLLHDKESWWKAIVYALTYAFSMLVVSCPCTFGLAVPTVMLTACGMAARLGVFTRDLKKLELARRVTDIIFDVTRTLTHAAFDIVQEEYYGSHETRTKCFLLTLLRENQNPIAIAVLQHLQSQASAGIDRHIEPIAVRMT